MSVDDRRVVSADEARMELRTMGITGGGIPRSLHEAYAHTVAAQAEQIAAVLKMTEGTHGPRCRTVTDHLPCNCLFGDVRRVLGAGEYR